MEKRRRCTIAGITVQVMSSENRNRNKHVCSVESRLVLQMTEHRMGMDSIPLPAPWLDDQGQDDLDDDDDGQCQDDLDDHHQSQGDLDDDVDQLQDDLDDLEDLDGHVEHHNSA